MSKNEELVFKTLLVVFAILFLVGIIYVGCYSPEAKQEQQLEKDYLNCLKDYAKTYCEGQNWSFNRDLEVYSCKGKCGGWDYNWEFKCLTGSLRNYEKKYEYLLFLEEEKDNCSMKVYGYIK